MPMNLLHRRLCSSAGWAQRVADLLPDGLAGLDLGGDVLEIGPGFGATTRVLRPGGVFRKVDSLPSLRFRLLHVGDTMVTLDPATLPGRLRTAGFADVTTDHRDGVRIRFVAHRSA